MGQSQPLLNAKTVLLVSYDEPQLAPPYLRAQEGMGPDQNVDFAGGELRESRFPVALPNGAREKARPHPISHKLPESVEVLRGKDLRRSHEGSLPAVFHSRDKSPHGHYGFAAPHVTLKQPVHGVPRPKVTPDILNGSPLGGCQPERETGQEGIGLAKRFERPRARDFSASAFIERSLSEG